jgi:nucleotide-binding universal stress UspA family protein
MTYKSILVHVDESSGCAARLALAIDLVRRFEGRLIGVGAEIFYPGLGAPGGYIDVQTSQLLLDLAQQNLDRAESRFRTATAGLSTFWRGCLERPGTLIADEACGADLIVASRDQRPGPEVGADPGELIMTSGLPVLVAPPGVDRLSERRILVGWKNTLQARSAITAALPLLKTADHVEVASVKVSQEFDAMAELGDVVERLRLHGVKAVCEAHDSARGSVAQALLDRAHDQSADLIVIGAYAHPRLSEWVFGGVTHHLLAHAEVPVLYAR